MRPVALIIVFASTMIGFIILGVASFSLIASGEAQEYRSSRGFSQDEDVAYEKPTTPVPILKQINTRNDDGSYTYGFEAADGSFKIETKEANGEVRGKYGYTDETGKLHVVEYGANKFGFQPAGEGITVPPLNLGADPEPEQEPEQRQAPRVFKQSRRPQAAPAPQRAHAPSPAPEPQITYSAPAPQPRIAYSAPVPKRPQFFAGAQPVVEPQNEDNYDYEQPAPVRPVQNFPRPQFVQYQTAVTAKPAQQIKYTQTERPVANFIPSPQFRQNVQFAPQTEYRQAPAPVQYESPTETPQYFRQEPTRPHLSRFSQPQAQLADEEPRNSYAPRAPKAKTSFFDQLQEQYSLPKSSGQAEHDVSFGFY